MFPKSSNELFEIASFNLQKERRKEFIYLYGKSSKNWITVSSDSNKPFITATAQWYDSATKSTPHL
jgi:hypothetical protein